MLNGPLPGAEPDPPAGERVVGGHQRLANDTESESQAKPRQNPTDRVAGHRQIK